MAIPWGEIIGGVVSIVGSVFSNKSKSDAVKVSQDSLKRMTQEQQSSDEAAWKSYVAGQDKRFIELGRQAKFSVFGKTPKLTPEQQAEYDALKLADTSKRDQIVAKMFRNPISGVSNAVTNPDGGFLSGLGSSANPLDIGEVSIKSSLDKAKKAGLPAWLLIGAAGVGVYIFSQSNNPKNRRKRRR